MTTLTTTTSTAAPGSTALRSAAYAAGLGSLISVLTGVTQLVYPQDLDPAIDPRTRVMLVATSVLLWCLAVVYLTLSRYARSRWAGRTAAAGTLLLTVGTTTSAAYGTDLAFFPPVAAVANGLWLVGSIWLALSLLRARRVPRTLALLLILVQPATIFVSQLGGGIVAGAYLAVLGYLLGRGQLERGQG